MQINDANQFLNALGEVGLKSGHYIHAHFVVKQEKSTLKTVDIAIIAEGCFQCYRDAKGLSVQRRHELMTEITSKIKVYEDRVFKSKSFWQKIGWVFGCISDGEKHLRRITKQVETEKTTYAKSLEEFEKIGKIHERRVARNSLTNEMKQASMKLLEGTNYSEFEGFAQSGGIKSYIEDLEAFRETLGPTPLLNKVNHTIKLLNEAYSFANLYESAATAAKIPAEVSIPRKNIIDELQSRIVEKIEHLHEKGKVGDQVIFPGGYQNIDGKGRIIGGHSVIYRIVKTDQDKCALTIINTGEGSNEAFDWNNTVLAFTGTGRVNVVDVLYENIPFTKLDQNFVKAIADPIFEAKVNEPMKRVEGAVDRVLAPDTSVMFKDSAKVQKGSGRKHKSQTTGSCSFKSVSSFIHENLGNDYQSFKVFVTQRELKRVEGLKTKVKSQTNQANLAGISANGQKILSHRQKKLLK